MVVVLVFLVVFVLFVAVFVVFVFLAVLLAVVFFAVFVLLVVLAFFTVVFVLLVFVAVFLFAVLSFVTFPFVPTFAVALNVVVFKQSEFDLRTLSLPHKSLELLTLWELTLLMLKISTTSKVKRIIFFLIVTPHFFVLPPFI